MSDSVIPRSVRRNHWMNHVAVHARMRPDATAFKYLGAVTTWSEFHDRVQSLAAALQRRGVGFGDRVMLLTLNSTEVLEAVFAVNTLGAMAVPINIRLTPPEIAFIIDDADADAIIADALLAPLIGATQQITSRLKRIIILGDASPDSDHESSNDLIAEPLDGFEAPDVAESTPALIMYTSGTTGRPKGAMLDHLNLFSQATSMVRINGDHPDDVAFVTAPFFHIAGLGSIATSFLLGIPSIIHPLGAFNALDTIKAWEAERATVVFNVPTQWQAIVAEPYVKEADLALRIISWGAAPASETLLRQMTECFPNATNIAVFGQTEMSPVTCALSGEDSLRKLGSVGKPLPTLMYRVVDAEMNDVAVGEVGEIVYLGPNLMQGYWRRDDATAEAFRGGWFHSGDLVRQDEEGFVWIVDRAKDMIISGGENVYCAEVENTLFAHPDIVDVAVYGRADDKWGEVPVAAVVLAPGAQLTIDELEVWMDDKLARFKQPKALVVHDELPRNAGGKVVKGLLRDGDSTSAVG